MTSHSEPPSRGLARLLALSPPVAIAHRGGSKLRPENTVVAFEHAVRLGVDAIECDVHLSSDGDAVVIHDATLDRTTDQTGPVSALTADELSRVDAGYRFGEADGFPYRGIGAGVPRLSHVLRRVADVPVIVEIKGEAPETAGRVLEIVTELGAGDRVVIAGFSDVVLSSVRQRSTDLMTSASVKEVTSALRRSYFRISPRRTGAQVFQVPLRMRGRRVLTKSFVRAVRRAGIPVHAWIIDEPEEMRMLLDWGVSGVISDRPDLALEIVRAHEQTR